MVSSISEPIEKGIIKKSMSRKMLGFTKHHVSEAIIMIMLSLVVGIYAHALTEQGKIKDRVRQVEKGNAAALEAVKHISQSLDTRTSLLYRELEQRSETTHRELVTTVERIDERCSSIELLITTLIGMIQQNDLGLNPGKDQNSQED